MDVKITGKRGRAKASEMGNSGVNHDVKTRQPMGSALAESFFKIRSAEAGKGKEV